MLVKIISLTKAEVRLDRAGLVTLTDAAGLSVQCRTGLAWMTVEADATDYWLTPGECVRIASPGRVIIEAEEPSALFIWRAIKPSIGRCMKESLPRPSEPAVGPSTCGQVA